MEKNAMHDTNDVTRRRAILSFGRPKQCIVCVCGTICPKRHTDHYRLADGPGTPQRPVKSLLFVMVLADVFDPVPSTTMQALGLDKEHLEERRIV